MPSKPTVFKQIERENGRQYAALVVAYQVTHPDANPVPLNRSPEDDPSMWAHGLHHGLIELVYAAVRTLQARNLSVATVATSLFAEADEALTLAGVTAEFVTLRDYRAAVSYGRTTPIGNDMLLEAAVAAIREATRQRVGGAPRLDDYWHDLASVMTVVALDTDQ